MAVLSLNLKDNRGTFAPGEVIEGEAAWELTSPPKRIYLRLFWFTRGKGTEDVIMVSETVFDHPPVTDTQSFKISLPQSPYSFSGKLVSLIWALELTVKGDDLVTTKEIVMSPHGYEIDLAGNPEGTSSENPEETS